MLISGVQEDSLVIPQRATFEVQSKRLVYVVDEKNVAHRARDRRPERVGRPVRHQERGRGHGRQDYCRRSPTGSRWRHRSDGSELSPGPGRPLRSRMPRGHAGQGPAGRNGGYVIFISARVKARIEMVLHGQFAHTLFRLSMRLVALLHRRDPAGGCDCPGGNEPAPPKVTLTRPRAFTLTRPFIAQMAQSGMSKSALWREGIFGGSLSRMVNR